MSSAESFVSMLSKAPNVKTMGDRTAGSSDNPRTLELPGKIAVTLPRWLDRHHDGKPIDRVGIPPQVPVRADANDFSGETDPVLRAALRALQAR